MAKPKVYLSSTFLDLKAYRKEVIASLDRAGYDTTCMEKYPAFEERPADKCLRDVAECDFYVLVLAHRYGFVPPRANPRKRSITHLEYDQAIKSARPCFVFLLDEGRPWDRRWVDDRSLKPTSEIGRLRATVALEHGRKLFTDEDDLAKQVLEALSDYRMRRSPAAAAAVDAGTIFRAARRIAASDPLAALASLWHVFANDEKAFEDLTPRGELRRKWFDREVSRIEDMLDGGDEDGLARIGDKNSLALATALDRTIEREHGWQPTTIVTDVQGLRHWVVSDHGERAARSLHAGQGGLERFIVNRRLIPADAGNYPVRIVQHANDLDLPRAMGEESITLFLGSFGDGIGLARAGEQITGLNDEAKRSVALESSLEVLSLESAHVAVFPELAITMAQRGRIVDWLADTTHDVRLLVPGSFHIVDGGSVVNHSCILDRDGSVLIEHRKMLPLQRAGGDCEVIRPGEAIELLQTSIGVIGLLICRDFCDEARLASLRAALRVDWFLVPSLDDSLSPHFTEACRHVRSGATVVVANQTPDGAAAVDDGRRRQKSFCLVPDRPPGRGSEPDYVERPEGRIAVVSQPRVARKPLDRGRR
jgi:hypothetical protein